MRRPGSGGAAARSGAWTIGQGGLAGEGLVGAGSEGVTRRVRAVRTGAVTRLLKELQRGASRELARRRCSQLPPARPLNPANPLPTLCRCPLPLPPAVTSALSSLQSLSSSGPAPPSADSLSSLLPADLSAALSAPAAAALAAAGLDPAAPLPPHFGTAAVAAGVEALAGWAGGRFQGLELYDSAAAAALGSALDELRSVAGLMTLPPAPSLGGAWGGGCTGSRMRCKAAGVTVHVSRQG